MPEVYAKKIYIYIYMFSVKKKITASRALNYHHSFSSTEQHSRKIIRTPRTNLNGAQIKREKTQNRIIAIGDPHI